MKVIFCFLIFTLSAYADDEKIEVAFTNRYFTKVIQGQKNDIESTERGFVLMKEAPFYLTMKNRKVSARETLKNTEAKLDGNTFTGNATATYLDAQEDAIFEIEGKVGEKTVKESGQISVKLERLRKSVIIEKATLSDTHVRLLKATLDNEWTKPVVKVTGIDLAKMGLTTEDVARAVQDELEIQNTRDKLIIDTEDAKSYDRKLTKL